MLHHSCITSQNAISSRDQCYGNISMENSVSKCSQLRICIVWVMVFPKQGPLREHYRSTPAACDRHVPTHANKESHRVHSPCDCLHTAHVTPEG